MNRLPSDPASLFQQWVHDALPGDEFCYHLGLLAPDRASLVTIDGQLRMVFNRPVDDAGKMAMLYYECGYVLLYQRRISRRTCAYMAVRLREKPTVNLEEADDQDQDQG